MRLLDQFRSQRFRKPISNSARILVLVSLLTQIIHCLQRYVLHSVSRTDSVAYTRRYILIIDVQPVS